MTWKKRLTTIVLFIFLAAMLYITNMRTVEHVDYIQLTDAYVEDGRIYLSGEVSSSIKAVDGVQYEITDSVATIQVYTAWRIGGKKEFSISIPNEDGKILKVNVSDDKNIKFLWEPTSSSTASETAPLGGTQLVGLE